MSRSQIEVWSVSHLGITVSNLDESVLFYTEVLGFVTCFEDVQDEWRRVGLALGDTVVELFSPHPSSTDGCAVDPFYPSEYGRPKLALTVSNIEAAFEQLSEVGLTPLCPITTTSMSQFFIISDPDGTPIQLHQFKAGQLRLAEVFGLSSALKPEDQRSGR